MDSRFRGNDGNRHLRRALYMPALVAVQHDPSLRAYHQHLLTKGKFKMQALAAVMRKLLHAIFGMFKHHQLYDGSKVFCLPTQAGSPSTSENAAYPIKSLEIQERIYPLQLKNRNA